MTSGCRGSLPPWRALRLLLVLGSSFAALTFVAGDHLTPAAGKAAQLLKAGFTGQTGSGPTGAWLKERQGERQFSVNVAGMASANELQGIKIFEFDAQGRLVERRQAEFTEAQAMTSMRAERFEHSARVSPICDLSQARLRRGGGPDA